MIPSRAPISQPFNLSLLVPPRTVNVAIGTKGSIIVATEKETQCSISFDKDDEYVNGLPLRMCRIGGPSIEQVLAAARKVWEADDKFSEARLAIVDNLVAVVIGKSGSMITEVQNNTGVSMSFCKAPEMGRLQGQTRALTIKGDSVQLGNAIAMVLELLNDFVKKGDGGFQSIRQQNAPPREAPRANGIANFQPSTINFPQQFATHGANYDEVVTEQFFVLPDLVALAIGKSGTTIKQIAANCGNPSIAFEANDETIGTSVFRRCTISGTMKSVAAAGASLSKLDGNTDPQIILLIPDPAVSLIIGGNGQTIRQITEMSGAYLSFAKKEEMGILCGEQRSLIIKGAANSVEVALVQVLRINRDSTMGPRGEKRPPLMMKPEMGGLRTQSVKKAKWDMNPQESDVCIALPPSLRQHFNDSNAQQIEQSYGVQCFTQEDNEDLVIHISGENSLTAQQDLQVQLCNMVGPIRWQIRCELR